MGLVFWLVFYTVGLVFSTMGSTMGLVFYTQLWGCDNQILSKFPSRYNIFAGCPGAKTCTLILRGGAEQFIEETERSLHDAIMIVRRTIKNDAVVAGECDDPLPSFSVH